MRWTRGNVSCGAGPARAAGEPHDEVTTRYEALVTYLRAAARDGDGVLPWIG
ncbi:hypothetical protein [Streptomyces albogriseolus]|uniref:hypothetical protein n=1 Tax=Streptomyces albogriseolus TaxID=1887 RepID=UPI0033BF4642